MRSGQFQEFSLLPAQIVTGRRRDLAINPVARGYDLSSRVHGIRQLGVHHRHRRTCPAGYDYHTVDSDQRGPHCRHFSPKPCTEAHRALITRDTRMIAGLTVSCFLAHHIKARDSGTGQLLARTIVLRNEFPEENITGSSWMTSLSGCQTRSLLIAGANLIGRTPISLPDEVENAMTFKERVIHCLKHHHKAVIFVTRDPITGCRTVMRNGAVMNVLEPKDAEKEMIAHITGIDGILCSLREKIRAGDLISDKLKITRPGISA